MKRLMAKMMVLVFTFSHLAAFSAPAPARQRGIDQEIHGVMGEDPGVYRKRAQAIRAKAPKAKQPSLSADEALAIYGYSVALYRPINQRLRSGKTQDIQSYLKAMDSALAKLPAENGVVYRGTEMPSSVLEKYTTGAVVEEPAYLSTSKAPVASGTTVLIVQSKTGRDISRYSANPGSREVLFPRGAKFRISSRTTNDNGIDVIEMAEVLN